MKHLDQDIEEIEQRIARRRLEIEQTARETGQLAMRKLSSPAVLLGVAALGFLAGGGVRRREPKRYPDRRKTAQAAAAKKTGVAGLLMTGAMWLIKSQLGSPAAIAQLLSRLKSAVPQQRGSQRAQPMWSPRGDSRTAQTYR